MLTPEDYISIQQVLSLHGHLVDQGRLQDLDQVFTLDTSLDLQAFGLGIVHGLEAIREVTVRLGDANPVAHHITNTVVQEQGVSAIKMLSKGIGIKADGTCGSVTYEDVLVRQDSSWRIASRRITVRQLPLRP